jgi:hypothetical protein
MTEIFGQRNPYMGVPLTSLISKCIIKNPLTEVLKGRAASLTHFKVYKKKERKNGKMKLAIWLG